MKLKELCQRTGLSHKTIRLYEEKELFHPARETRNGRVYREYSEEDVQTLLVVASLRKAWFTMEEIRRMQQDPAAIGEILPQYREWLYAQKRQLDGLIAAADKLTGQDIASVEALSAGIETETKNLPLPVADIKPHFKYLDEMEEIRMKQTIDPKEQEKKAFRQTALVMDRDRNNDQAITFGAIRECEQLNFKQYDGPVTREEQEPLWVRIISVLGGITLAIGIVAFAIAVFLNIQMFGHYDGNLYRIGGIMIVVGLVLYGGMRGYMAWKERQRWLQVVREQDEAKRKKE